MDVPCKVDDLLVLQGGFRKGRGHKMSSPEHTDVWLWGLEATISGGLSPSGKFASLLSRDQGFVFTPSYSRLNMPGNLGMMGSDDVVTTPAMVL